VSFIIPHEPLPLEFLSFIATINDIFYFLDVVPQTWTRYLFKPSDEEADKVRTPNHRHKALTDTSQLSILLWWCHDLYRRMVAVVAVFDIATSHCSVV
jgi:hypothetical protein